MALCSARDGHGVPAVFVVVALAQLLQLVKHGINQAEIGGFMLSDRTVGLVERLKEASGRVGELRERERALRSEVALLEATVGHPGVCGGLIETSSDSAEGIVRDGSVDRSVL